MKSMTVRWPSQTPIPTCRWPFISWMLGVLLCSSTVHAQELSEQLRNLTGLAATQALLVERETFGNEFQYEVRIRNQSPDPLQTETLIIVLDQITTPTGEDVLDRMEIMNQDGEIKGGKPYFKLPPSSTNLLPPYTDSQPVPIRFRNPDYLPQFTPVFQLWGLRQLSPSGSLNALVNLLIKKGVITEADWKAAIQNAR